MVETRNVVILGASLAGLSAAHYFLRHIHPHLPQSEGITYRAVLVDPSTRFYWRPASPRAVASEQLAPHDDLFLDYRPAFEVYGDKITIIHGAAVAWYADTRTIVIKDSEGDQSDLPYHALILATGTRSSSPLFSLQGTDHTDVEAALQGIRAQLSRAKHVVVAGGGPSGVETAGEIAEWLNRSADKQRTKVTLLTSADRLLPLLRPSIAAQAALYLEGFGVDIRYQTKVMLADEVAGGQTEVILHNGERFTADVYIPAIGLTPMTEYAPRHLLDAQGYVDMDKRTMRVDKAGPLVYAIGDVGSYSGKGIVDIMLGIPVLGTNMKRDVIAAHDCLDNKPTGPDRILKALNTETQLLPVGQSRGVGAVFGWRLPDLVIWLLKGGHMKARGGQEWIDGDRWKSPEWIVSRLTKAWEVEKSTA